MTYKIYTDGSSNQGSASLEDRIATWAYVIINEKGEVVFEDSSVEKYSTNNRCEMIPILQALKKSKELNLEGIKEVCCDSAYVVNAFNENWIQKWLKNGWVNSKGEPVVNKDLWLELVDIALNKPDVKMNKIKRASDTFSKRVDGIARKKLKENFNKGNSSSN